MSGSLILVGGCLLGQEMVINSQDPWPPSKFNFYKKNKNKKRSHWWWGNLKLFNLGSKSNNSHTVFCYKSKHLNLLFFERVMIKPLTLKKFNCKKKILLRDNLLSKLNTRWNENWGVSSQAVSLFMWLLQSWAVPLSKSRSADLKFSSLMQQSWDGPGLDVWVVPTYFCCHICMNHTYPFLLIFKDQRLTIFIVFSLSSDQLVTFSFLLQDVQASQYILCYWVEFQMLERCCWGLSVLTGGCFPHNINL